MNKQIQIKWPENKDGSVLTPLKWAKLNLSKEEYEKFLNAEDNHQRIVAEAVLRGDAINKSVRHKVDIQWKDEQTHNRYMSMISKSESKIWHDVLDRYWSYIDQNHNGQYSKKNC